MDAWKEALKLEFIDNGAKMHYEIAGSGERTLLLLHGWGGSAENWLPVIRDFQDAFRVIAVDFPGFGKSPEPSTGWSVTEYANLTLSFLRSLNIKSVDLIAHSFGGRVALKMSQIAPEIARRQILTGCAGLPPKETGAGKLSKSVFQALAAVADNRLTRAVAGDANIEKARDKMRAHFGSEDYRNASPLMRQTFQRVIAQDLTDCLPCVRASTLLVWGENDTATPLWMGKAMEKGIRDAGLVVFEGCGHFAYLEKYARFLAVSRKFLIG